MGNTPSGDKYREYSTDDETSPSSVKSSTSKFPSSFKKPKFAPPGAKLPTLKPHSFPSSRTKVREGAKITDLKQVAEIKEQVAELEEGVSQLEKEISQLEGEISQIEKQVPQSLNSAGRKNSKVK